MKETGQLRKLIESIVNIEESDYLQPGDVDVVRQPSDEEYDIASAALKDASGPDASIGSIGVHIKTGDIYVEDMTGDEWTYSPVTQEIKLDNI